VSANIQSSTPSDTDQRPTPEPRQPLVPALWSSSPEPIRIPVDVHGVTVDLYAVSAPVRDADGLSAIETARPRTTPAYAALHNFRGADESDLYVWDQLSFALAQIEGTRDAAARETPIRRAVHRCADAAAAEAWTLEQFVARFQLTIERPFAPGEDEAAVSSMLHRLHARFIAKVLEWGIERFLVASEALKASDGNPGARSA
jgi:hypothetical protein